MSTKQPIPIPILGLDDHDSFSIDQDHVSNLRNVRSFRSRIVRAPGGTLLAPTPGSGSLGSSVTSGTLTSPNVTGSVTYSHNLGIAPSGYYVLGSAYLFPPFVPGHIVASVPQNSYATMVGISDGTDSRCRTHATKNNSNPTISWGAQNTSLIYLIDKNGNVLLTADVTASTATTFTLNWTAVDASNSYVIGWTLFGGTGVAVKLIEWTEPAATGVTSVIGVGFTPQIVFHIREASLAPGPVEGAGSGLSFGAMVDFTHQCAITSLSVNNESPAITQLVIDNTSCHINTRPDGTINVRARWFSMDADGFSVRFTAATTDVRSVASLCMAGFTDVDIGVLNKTAASAPTNQSVTGVSFQPDWVWMAQTNATVANVIQPGIRRSDGFTDGITQFVIAEQAENAVSPLNAHGNERTDMVVDQVNNAATDVALAQFSSFDADGFTINYVLNNANIGLAVYIAIQTGNGGQFGVIRNYAQLYLGVANTEKLLMLTNKSAFIYHPVTTSTGTWTPTAENYTGNEIKRFSIVNTQTIAAWSQGVDNIRQWDGASFSALVTTGTDRAARSLLSFADRIIAVRPFITGVDQQTQISWSVNGNVNDWASLGSGTLEIVETSQAPLTGAFVLGSRAYLGKERELIELIWTGTLGPVFRQETRVRGMGILATHSVGLAEDRAFWLGPDDIYMWDGQQLTAVGDRVYNTITQLIDFNTLDNIQGAVYTPDSQYWLVIPPNVFIYDYRRDTWYRDDSTNFEAIGIFNIGTNVTANIGNSQFVVIGDSQVQTIRVDKTNTTYLGNPIDSYFETRDYTYEELAQKGSFAGAFRVNLWDLGSLRELRFQSNVDYRVEVGISLDRGVSWDVRNVTVNQTGVGVAWFQAPFSQIRFRLRDFGTDSYEIHGNWGFDVETAGYQLP